MKSLAAIAAFTIAVAIGFSDAAAQRRACHSPDPIDTLEEMSAAIFACWQPPPGTAGMSLTLLFSLRRNGTLIGKPRATYSNLGPDEKLNRAFVASVLKALDTALPLPFSESMGGAIAGRVLAPRFTATIEGRS
ncbi:hypothetical protein [Mesorhizobium sp. B1-1-8]|uniref:hypothetical protein n=1 Tax=Mesorhizobium sp. B1-1-8 TaxID=2589976 RepID=UPI00112B1680|nr:hypothetical protein [Mesorhizobium sp. B1-1-8]UCI05430.1 hypothetical protein FJ974_16395 [Mesorhizobium sp. B1-1-8]